MLSSRIVELLDAATISVRNQRGKCGLGTHKRRVSGEEVRIASASTRTTVINKDLLCPRVSMIVAVLKYVAAYTEVIPAV